MERPRSLARGNGGKGSTSWPRYAGPHPFTTRISTTKARISAVMAAIRSTATKPVLLLRRFDTAAPSP
jgi:hypothetical protein